MPSEIGSADDELGANTISFLYWYAVTSKSVVFDLAKRALYLFIEDDYHLKV